MGGSYGHGLSRRIARYLLTGQGDEHDVFDSVQLGRQLVTIDERHPMSEKLPTVEYMRSNAFATLRRRRE